MIPGTVKSIKVSGVYGQGDYNLSNASWTSLANPSTYVIKLDASVKAGESKALTGGENDNKVLMMIPQTFDANNANNAKVSMVFNDGAKDKTVSFRLHDTSWDAGKHITYVLSSSKITTLKMGDLTYPTGTDPTCWNSVNKGATNPIRTAYDPNDPNSSVDAGLFVVNDENKVIAANVQLTYDGNSWSLPADSKLKFSPKYNYFVYYPYQASLAGLPVVNNTPISDVSISSSTQFFADAIATWKSNNIAADQSTLKMMNDCDLQIGKASLDEDGCSVSFKMEHAMGLAVLNRESKSVPKHYTLIGYHPSYTWDNGTTTLIPSATLSNSQKLYATTNTQGVKVIPPSAAFPFSSTSIGNDAWTDEVNITAAANGVGTGTATIKATKVDYNYTMEVGDIYYSDGAMTHQSEALASDKTPIGIVGYLGNDYWTESNTGSGYGGHALVMCLKNIGSNSTTDMGSNYQWYSSDTDCGRFKVDTGDKIRGSSDKDYGSGYKETTIAKESAFEAANAAKNYTSLPAPRNKCTGWFLPSAGQYYAVMSQLGGGISPDTWEINEFFGNMTTVSGNINAALSKVGPDQYTEFFQGNNVWVWTSSELSSTMPVNIDSGIDDKKPSGSVRFRFHYKTTKFPVRPFLAF